MAQAKPRQVLEFADEDSPRSDYDHGHEFADSPLSDRENVIEFEDEKSPVAQPKKTTFAAAPSSSYSSAGSSTSRSGSTMIAMLQKHGYNLEDPDGSALGSSSILQLREAKNNQTAFHIAVKKGHVDVLKALMKLPRAEEFVNVPDKMGNTPLHFVASKDNADLQHQLGTLLLSLGANLHAMNVRGQTPLEVHIVTARADTVAFVQLISFRGMNLNTHINGTTYLHMAMERGFIDMSCALVKAGASINFPDHNGVMVSDTVPRQTLMKMIKYMREGTQASPPDVPRVSCKLCKNPKGLLDAMRDCTLCGRVMCRNCCKKLSDIKDPEEARREKLDKEALAARYCHTCCLVLQLRDKRLADKKRFNDSLMGMNRV
ncbi:myosin-like protein [Achlya hypogyna]|uniref:Myosin-like protein n=1 Tax=Achlya hypogyna TaxID=1202772 RepID=A0A1V9YX07_ACHHY|nr:myosin-like protein [Achlya hypogyna]